jgi:hypothetical protein
MTLIEREWVDEAPPTLDDDDDEGLQKIMILSIIT